MKAEVTFDLSNDGLFMAARQARNTVTATEVGRFTGEVFADAAAALLREMGGQVGGEVVVRQNAVFDALEPSALAEVTEWVDELLSQPTCAMDGTARTHVVRRKALRAVRADASRRSPVNRRTASPPAPPPPIRLRDSPMVRRLPSVWWTARTRKTNSSRSRAWAASPPPPPPLPVASFAAPRAGTRLAASLASSRGTSLHCLSSSSCFAIAFH